MSNALEECLLHTSHYMFSQSINNIKSETRKCSIYLLPELNVRPKSELLILNLSVTGTQLPNCCNNNQTFRRTDSYSPSALYLFAFAVLRHFSVHVTFKSKKTTMGGSLQENRRRGGEGRRCGYCSQRKQTRKKKMPGS